MDHDDGSATDGEALRVDELSARTGVPVRTIREYQTWKVLHPPRKVGRVGIYDRSHVDRLADIARLQDRGYSIAAIRDLFDAWDRGAGLRDVLGVRGAIGAPADEAPLELTARQLHDLVPQIADAPPLMRRAVDVGLLWPRRDGFVVRSPALLQLVSDTVGAGVGVDAALDVAEAVTSAADEVGRAASGAVAALLGSDPADREALLRTGRILLARAIATHAIDRVGRHLLADPTVPAELANAIEAARLGTVATPAGRPSTPAADA
ncbi:MerR family transcriptional regulator [Dermatobacter hominis]|uniref:MerR family transcriptional regulator n=1 Tax=Dermatobacter hominis TaxID=2884263 RepID=UPI001D12F2B1|nr:MerR family transcriptional regulator [Dermatobacter hominis]UDY37591.1 MerR family transcriptional regulator [Dermatobacter hominis]